MPGARLPPEALERLQRRIQVNPETGCWEWTGGKAGKGYGVVRLRKQLHYTHRLAYETIVGPIPDGLQIDHLCRNHGCCNPDHLEPVTPSENARRGAWGQKTHCPQGHAYDKANTHIYRGSRRCRACHAEQERRRRAA